ncbi:MAG: hypothetical protein R3D00_22535 [Bacteroidia bacterium]
MSAVDNHIEVARFQTEIAKKLDISQANLVFNFTNEGEKVLLDLITINPKHDQSFLYHSVESTSKSEALRLMLEYITKNFRQEHSFTVQWTKKGQGELHTSYFRARDMYEVLDKFSHGRDVNDYTIFSITLNPIS